MRALSTVLSFLLAVTLFDASAVSVLAEEAAADPAPVEEPASSAEEQEEESAPPSEGSSASSEEAATAPGASDAPASSDASSDNDSDQSAEATPKAADEEAPSAPDSGAKADGSADKTAASERESLAAIQQQPLDQEALRNLMPAQLTDVAQVLPQTTLDGATAEMSQLVSSALRPELAAWGAPLVSSGYLTDDQRLSVRFGLGNRAVLLQGGALGGMNDADPFVFTLDVPYLYEKDDGTMATTLSEEEWRLRLALATEAQKAADDATATLAAVQDAAAQRAQGDTPRSAARAVLYGQALPKGWTLWQVHGEGYRRITEAELQEGVSGRLVLRAENPVTAETELPAFELGLKGSVPEGAQVDVVWGYEVRSMSDAAGAVTRGLAKRAAAGSVTLCSGSDIQVKAARQALSGSTLAIKGAAAPLMTRRNGAGLGWATSLVTFAVAGESPAASGIAVTAQWPADEQGRGGVAKEDLRYSLAVLADDDQGSDQVRYIGKPGEGGVIVLDVSALTDEQRATLDPADAASLRALGLAPLPYTVSKDGVLSVALEGDEGSVDPGQERVLFFAAPVREQALTPAWSAQDEATYQSELLSSHRNVLLPYEPLKGTFSLHMSVGAGQRTVVLSELRDCSYTFTVDARAEIAAAGSSNAGGNAASGAEGQKPSSPTGGAAGESEGVGSGDAANGSESTEGAGSPEGEGVPRPSLETDAPLLSDAPTVFGVPEEDPIDVVTQQALHPTAYVLGAPFAVRAAGELNLKDVFNPYPAPLGSMEALPDAENIYLIKDTGTADAGFVAELGFLDLPEGGWLGDKDHPTQLTLVSPYLYKTDEGAIIEARTYKEYQDGIKRYPNANPETEPMRLAIIPDSSLFMDFSVLLDGTPISLDVYKEYYKDGLSGTITLVYTGSDGTFELDSSFQRPVFHVAFLGKVPENTSAVVRMGGRVECYTDPDDGVTHVPEVPFQIEPGEMNTGDSQLRSITFIKTNLQWETKVQKLWEPILWDKYNYTVYRVETTNTSTEEDTVIDLMRYAVRVSHESSPSGGVRRADLMVWDENGNKIPQLTNDIMKNGSFIGKPDEGGVLIYDMTDRDDVWNQLDHVKFSNIDDFGLTPLPYQNLGIDGMVTFRVDKPIYPPQSPVEGARDKLTLLVAVPYTTNISYYTNPSGNKIYSTVAFDTTSTVVFGGKGDKGYTWSKQGSASASFIEPKNGFEVHKTAWDYDRQAWQGDGGQGSDRIGYESKYRIYGMKASGNVKIAGPDVNTAWGPIVNDDLPKNYELTGLDFRVRKDALNTQLYDAKTVTAASLTKEERFAQWFCAEAGVVQFEVGSDPGAGSWVDTPVAPTYKGEETEGGVTYEVWTLGTQAGQPNIAQMLEAQGIAAKVRSSLLSTPNPLKFTGNVRFLMAKEFAVGATIPVDITVRGIMRHPASDGSEGRYTNKATVNYGRAQWVVPVGDQGNCYTAASLNTKTAQAHLLAIGPVQPTVQARAYDVSPTQGMRWGAVGGTQNAPWGEERSGFIFQLSNPSRSKAEPGSFSTSNLSYTACDCRWVGTTWVPNRPGSNLGTWKGEWINGHYYENEWYHSNHLGFDPSRVIISKGFLDNADITSVTLTFDHGTDKDGRDPLTLTRQQLQAYVVKAGSAEAAAYGTALVGSAVIPSSVWKGDGKWWVHLKNVSVQFDSFNGLVDSSTPGKGAFVAIHGEPTTLGTYPLTGTFETKYEDYENQKTQSTAQLKVDPSNPQCWAYAFDNASGRTPNGASDGSRWSDPVSGASNRDLEARLDEKRSGYVFHLVNPGDARMEPVRFETTKLPYALRSDGTFSGFVTDHVVISRMALEKISGFQFLQLDVVDSEGVASTIKLTEEELQPYIVATGSAEAAKYGTHLVGSVVVPSSVWGNGYLQAVAMETDVFASNVAGSRGANAYISLVGTVTAVGRYPLKGTFGTNYNDPKLDQKSSEQVTLVGVAPAPRINAFGLEMQGRSKVRMSRTGTQEAALGSLRSGYVYYLENRSLSRITPGKFSTTPVVHDFDKDGFHGFETSEVALGGALLSSAGITKVVIHSLEPDDEGSYVERVQTLSINELKEKYLVSASDAANRIYPVDGAYRDLYESYPYDTPSGGKGVPPTGSIIIPASAWENRYFSHIEVYFDWFASEVYFDPGTRFSNPGPHVALYGTPTKPDKQTVQGTLQSTYDSVLGRADVTNTSAGTLAVARPQPYVYAYGFEKNAPGDLSAARRDQDVYVSGNSRDRQTVALDDSRSGYVFYIGTGNGSKIMPGRLSTTALPFVRWSYDGKLHGFETEYVILNKAFLQYATITHMVLHSLSEDGSRSSQTISIADLKAKYLVAADGSTPDGQKYHASQAGAIIIPRSAWTEHFSHAEVYFNSFTEGVSGTNLGTSPYMAYHGTPTRVNDNDNEVIGTTAKFESLYGGGLDMNDTSNANLHVAKPQLELDTYAFDNSPLGLKYSMTQVQTAPLNANRSGFWFEFGSLNASAVVPGRFTSSDLPYEKWGDGYRGFDTTEIVLSRDFLARSRIASVRLYSRALDGTQVVKTLTAAELATYKVKAGDPAPSGGTYAAAVDGAVVLTPDVWDDEYFQHIEIDFDFYQRNVPVSATHPASGYVAIHGTPTKVQDIKVTGTFRTNYENPLANVTNSHAATLRITTIDPKLTTSSGWSLDGVQQAECGPYRWGEDSKRERAWMGYTMTNATESSAKDVDLTLSMNELAQVPSVAGSPSLKGFVPTLLEIGGFKKTAAGEWVCGTSIVSAIDLFDLGQSITGGLSNWQNDPTPAKSYSMDDLAAFIDASGTLKLPLENLADMTAVKNIRISFGELGEQATGANAFNVRVYGKVETLGDHSGTISLPSAGGSTTRGYTVSTAHFYPRTGTYGDAFAQKVDANFWIEPFSFGTSAAAFRPATSQHPSGYAEGSSVPVAVLTEGSGYKFTVANGTQARANANRVVFDLESVINRSDTSAVFVRGFKARTLAMDAGLFNLGAIRKDDGSLGSSLAKIKFYFASNVTGIVGNTPDIELSLADLAAYQNDPSDYTKGYTFALDQGAFAPFKDRYLKTVVVDYGVMAPAYASGTLHAQFVGRPDWYNSVDSSNALRGRVTATQLSDGRTTTAAADLYVPRPDVAVRTHGSYLDVRENDWAWTNDTNCDYSESYLAVPYDRDFTLWTQLYNNTHYSIIEDLDFDVSLFLMRESIVQETGGTKEAWTGFHATKATVSSTLFRMFDEVGTIQLGGPSESETVLPTAVKAVLSPVFDAAGALEGFVADDDGTAVAPGRTLRDGHTFYPLSGDGSLQLLETDFIALGIDHLTTLNLRGWKGMANANIDTSAQRITFNGYSDAALGSRYTFIEAHANAYMGAIRQAMALRHFKDSSMVYTSKMFFDLVSRSAFTDDRTTANGLASGAKRRFDRWAMADDGGHRLKPFGSYFSSMTERDFALEIGYKAQGSFLAGFRQSDLVRIDQARENWEGEWKNTYKFSDQTKAFNEWYPLSFKSLNTGVTMDIQQNLPSDTFDAYYLKIHPSAVDYVQSINITYRDGSTLRVSHDEIQAHKANAVQVSSTGQKFFRLNLLATDANGTHVADFSQNKAVAFRDAFDDYNYGDPPDALRVRTITYTLRINQSPYAPGTTTVAGTPDFGLDYNPKDPTTDAFEVTGRFFKVNETGVYCTTNSALRIGGDYSGSVRSGHKAAVRYDAGHLNGGTGGKSSWSFTDYIRDQNKDVSALGKDALSPYKMQHLISRAEVQVYETNNFVRKAYDVVKDGSFDGNDHDDVDGTGDVAFASDQRFAVSFARWQLPGGGERSNYENKDAEEGTYRIDTDGGGGTRGIGHQFDFYERTWGLTSHADEVVLRETLPVCRPDITAKYYGVLPTGIEIPLATSRTDVKDVRHYVDKIIFHTNQYSAATITGASITGHRDIVVTRAQLQGDAAVATGGSVCVRFKNPDNDDAPQLAGAPYCFNLQLNLNEFVSSFDIVMKEIEGSADYTTETGRGNAGAFHSMEFTSVWNRNMADLYVYGRPYAFADKKDPEEPQVRRDTTNSAETLTRRAYTGATEY
ncbi:MAG: hypothetical protein HFJ71_00580 [Eggerthellaceae bacterium]|nr:hypothetical protein [Eggerthellaceae bacterium]